MDILQEHPKDCLKIWIPWNFSDICNFMGNNSIWKWGSSLKGRKGLFTSYVGPWMTVNHHQLLSNWIDKVEMQFVIVIKYLDCVTYGRLEENVSALFNFAVHVDEWSASRFDLFTPGAWPSYF